MTLKIKTGETFLLGGTYLDDDGITPKSLAGVTLKSQIRTNNDVLVANLTVTVTNEAAGKFTLSCPEGTALWPVGTQLWDVMEVTSTGKRLTETDDILVRKGITRE